MRRSAFLLVTLCLLATVAGGWLASAAAGPERSGFDADVTVQTVAGGQVVAGVLEGIAPDAADDGAATQPCLLQDDCGGGTVLVVAAVLPLILVALRVLAPFGVLAGRPPALHPVRLARRLDRPPQRRS